MITIITTKRTTKGMAGADWAVAWSVMAGLVLVLVRYGQTMALPAHFV